jgi:hypothetical protein
VEQTQYLAVLRCRHRCLHTNYQFPETFCFFFFALYRYSLFYPTHVEHPTCTLSFLCSREQV